MTDTTTRRPAPSDERIWRDTEDRNPLTRQRPSAPRWRRDDDRADDRADQRRDDRLEDRHE